MIRLPSFYASVLSAWLRINGFRDSSSNLLAQLLPNSPPTPVHLLTANVAYHSLMISCFVPPVCEERFKNLGISSWSLVWSSIHRCKFIRWTLDTAWKIAHGVIPTADRLIHFRMNVSPRCFCQENESLEHLFHSCAITSQVLIWFSNILFSYRHNAPLVSIRHVLVGFERALAIPVGFQVLLHIIKHHIWLHRNSIRFDLSRPDSILLLNHIKTTFKFALRVQFRHTPISQFTAACLASGIFGYVSPDGELQFAACLQNIWTYAGFFPSSAPCFDLLICFTFIFSILFSTPNFFECWILFPTLFSLPSSFPLDLTHLHLRHSTLVHPQHH